MLYTVELVYQDEYYSICRPFLSSAVWNCRKHVQKSRRAFSWKCSEHSRKYCPWFMVMFRLHSLHLSDEVSSMGSPFWYKVVAPVNHDPVNCSTFAIEKPWGWHGFIASLYLAFSMKTNKYITWLLKFAVIINWFYILYLPNG